MLKPLEPPVPVSEPALAGNELEYVTRSLKEGWLSGQGPFVEQFESETAQRLNRRFGIAVNSGSTALEIALAALGIAPGDEVIVPTFTIISCASAVVRCGATPVFVDADPHTWNMSITDLDRHITSRTKAIIPTHIYGLPVDMNPVLTLAQESGLSVVEDAAQAFGQDYRDRPCGSMGEISILSFYANKLVTTGEGGMLLTDDEDLAHRCRDLRDLCFGRNERFTHSELGWSARLSSVQAAIGLAQLETSSARLQRKCEIGRAYNSALESLADVQIAPAETDFASNHFWAFGLVMRDRATRDKARDLLREYGVSTRPFFWPLHRQPALEDVAFPTATLPVADRLGDAGFYIPGSPTLSDSTVEAVAARVRHTCESLEDTRG